MTANSSLLVAEDLVWAFQKTFEAKNVALLSTLYLRQRNKTAPTAVRQAPVYRLKACFNTGMFEMGVVVSLDFSVSEASWASSVQWKFAANRSLCGVVALSEQNFQCSDGHRNMSQRTTLLWSNMLESEHFWRQQNGWDRPVIHFR